MQICVHKVIRFLSTWLATEVTYKHNKIYWLDPHRSLIIALIKYFGAEWLYEWLQEW